MKTPPAASRAQPQAGRPLVGRPFVFINMAMTADGKIATANRRITSFSSPRDHDHLLELRATADAVMSGARTVDLAPVTLGPGSRRFRDLRLRHGLQEYNLRVIASRTASVNPRAEVFRHRFSPILVLTAGCAPAQRVKALRRVADCVQAFGDDDLDLGAALQWLRQEWGVRRLLCEGGGELNDALFRADLVDELHLTVCPLIFGGRAAPTIADGVGTSRLPDARRYELNSMRRYGDEQFLVFSRLLRHRG